MGLQVSFIGCVTIEEMQLIERTSYPGESCLPYCLSGCRTACRLLYAQRQLERNIQIVTQLPCCLPTNPTNLQVLLTRVDLGTRPAVRNLQVPPEGPPNAAGRPPHSPHPPRPAGVRTVATTSSEGRCQRPAPQPKGCQTGQPPGWMILTNRPPQGAAAVAAAPTGRSAPPPGDGDPGS